MANVFLIDCDGTLCYGEAWTVDDCINAKPRKDVIDMVNLCSHKHFIVIYTARRDHLIPATLEWLRRNGVKFSAISNNKVGTDVGYLDDKCITIEKFLEGS